MKFVPHAYQQYAIDYIKSHPITALLLDMGLGKTVTTLTAIRDLMYDTFEVKRVLVVAPLRVARDTWPEEIRKWDHLKALTCSVVVGSAAERRKALQKKADIYIVNRENLVCAHRARPGYLYRARWLSIWSSWMSCRVLRTISPSASGP